jgi:SAM-dependent methyltransferase
MTEYKKIVKHYEECYEKHGDTSKGMDWPNEKENFKRFEVMLGMIQSKDITNSILDFGCGTSHLNEYIIDQQIKNITYSGCDLSKTFIARAKQKFPKIAYYELDLLKNSEKLPNFDYIICNGVFTEKQNLSFEEMWDYFKTMVSLLFTKVNKGIAFNVMSKAVDWERDDLFHLSTDLLISFITKSLNRNFVIRNDYGLYEYTVYVYK